MSSVHGYRNRKESLADFLGAPTPLFGTDDSVMSAWCRHGAWGLEHCQPVDTEALLKDPDGHAHALAEHYGWPLAAPAGRLPPKKRFSGRVMEVHQRLIGRQSTEVKSRPGPPINSIAHFDNDGETGRTYNSLRSKARDLFEHSRPLS